jgi:phage tail-like protein
MENYYPLPAFHFSVDFLNIKGEGSPPVDCRFSSVDGLGISNDIEMKEEAGVPYSRPMPVGKRKYNEVTLSRGFTLSSDLISWFNGAKYNDPIKPVPVLISLLNEKHKPVISWLLYESYLKSWTYGGFDALKNQYFMETIVLVCSHYKELVNDNSSSLQNVIDAANSLI